SDADGEDAQSLTLQLQTSPGNVNLFNGNIAGPFTDGVQTTVNFAALAIADLVPNNSYRWRSRTIDIHGNGAWSGWMNFTVDPIPGAPTDLTVNGFATGDAGLLNLPLGDPNATLTFGWTDNDHGDPSTGHSIVIFE